MDCPSCAMVLEGELEDRGVVASCSYAKAILEVEYDQDKITQKDIYDAVQKAGYMID